MNSDKIEVVKQACEQSVWDQSGWDNPAVAITGIICFTLILIFM